MKKVLLTFLSVLFIFSWSTQKIVASDSPEVDSNRQFTMIAPDLDMTTMTEEDKAILISLGWDFTGEVPTLVQTEEDLGFEIADSVAGSTIDLGEVFEHMDQSDNAIDTDDADFSLFSLPELDVGIGGGMSTPIFSPPAHGTKVYKAGNLVHCNRFNGPSTDNKHYDKGKAKAYINFAGSDCAQAVARGFCTYINDKCNSSIIYHRGWCSWKLGHKLTYHKH